MSSSQLIYSGFSFVLVSSPPRSYFSSKSRKESSEMMFPFKVDLSGNSSRIFSPKFRLVLFVFFGCYERPWLFSWSQAMTRGERSVKRKRRQNSNRTRTIAGSPLSRASQLFESRSWNNPLIRRACLQASEMITMCSPMVGHYFDTMIVNQVIIKTGYKDPSKSKGWKLL